MRQTNSPRDIFTRFYHSFQLNLDETSFLFHEGELKVLKNKYNPTMKQIAATKGPQQHSFGL